MALRAPEVILGYPWNGSADVWNLGCLIVELLTACWLFEAHATDEWDREEDHLVRMTESLEEQFPLDFLKGCDRRNRYFKEDGALLKRCLRLRPEDRATPRDLINDPWLASMNPKLPWL
ncbi:hypothetical protein FRC11_002423 [Ceratobasidium sp. 423]|nr:hypothetical protein FRC11_002423 [Ceratobasidium sp. 423]